jgi:PAS domain S-box-containing protein
MTADHAAAVPLEALAAACRDATSPPRLLEDAVPVLAELAGAAAAMVLERRSGEPHATVSWGAPLDVSPFDLHEHTCDGEDGFAVPDAWAGAGIVSVTCRELPGLWGHLVLAWTGDREPVEHEVAATLLVRSLAALDTEERLHDLQSRVDNAQQLASMGDYDWHIASDTNQWSDQLYRIYGHEPQSFNASYERFLSFIHPDDREMITQVHQRAYATGEPYQMVERIIRPDGEMRYLASNGQVLMGEEGTPLRFRGTCIDITDRVRAEQERERSRRLFQELVESSPDAIVVTDATGAIVSANGQAASLLGGQPVGRSLAAIFERPRDAEREVAETLGVVATGLDGRDLVLDVRSARLGPHGGEAAGARAPADAPDVGTGLVATFLRDATERLAGEAMAATLREAQVRRRQALEINDNVVQGLSAALYALEAGDPAVSTALQRRTLDAARTMMSDLLDPLDGTDLQPGELVRSEASSVAPAASRPASVSTGVPAPPAQRDADEERRPARVLVVDDSEDVRLLLTLKLDSVEGLEVVGEAPDGEEAVRLTAELQPDLVLLDLAMPRMDGLQALPLIRRSAPQVRVVVLSGFEDEVMADKAVRAGAARYVEKGAALSSLTQVIEETLAVA